MNRDIVTMQMNFIWFLSARHRIKEFNKITLNIVWGPMIFVWDKAAFDDKPRDGKTMQKQLSCEFLAANTQHGVSWRNKEKL